MGKQTSPVVKELERKACELRLDVVDMIACSDIRSGHFGGSLSAAEIVAVLYWGVMRVDPGNANWEDRDRLVLSKGHSVPVVYAALARKGFFDRSILHTYRMRGSMLQGHPDCRKTPGLDISSGSLGQGLSVALGMALAGRYLGRSFNVYALMSDGELDEGMVWEAAMAAAHYHVGSLTAIVDNNGLQVNGPIEKVMNPHPIDEKFRSFGWECTAVNGHDIEELLAAFRRRKDFPNKPYAIICKTVKGRGVSFMEGSADWHCAAIDEVQYRTAMKDLQRKLAACQEEE
ncbi:MAG TPA: transketolase [Spirochaetia bacterium]|nr:transketolase [Spirochaetia bacterium]